MSALALLAGDARLPRAMHGRARAPRAHSAPRLQRCRSSAAPPVKIRPAHRRLKRARTPALPQGFRLEGPPPRQARLHLPPGGRHWSEETAVPGMSHDEVCQQRRGVTVVGLGTVMGICRARGREAGFTLPSQTPLTQWNSVDDPSTFPPAAIMSLASGK